MKCNTNVKLMVGVLLTGEGFWLVKCSTRLILSIYMVPLWLYSSFVGLPMKYSTHYFYWYLLKLVLIISLILCTYYLPGVFFYNFRTLPKQILRGFIAWKLQVPFTLNSTWSQSEMSPEQNRSRVVCVTLFLDSFVSVL